MNIEENHPFVTYYRHYTRIVDEMSRHEGVSCDSCLKGNFRGRRYKCLVCYDYDLCATCFEAGATTTRHTANHPMQCILTHADIDYYYGGETGNEHQQSFTCPFCGKLGFTELMLQDHVAAEHADVVMEVVCPVCAAQPGGEPNLVTEDLSTHLSVTHGNSNSGNNNSNNNNSSGQQRDLITFLDETGTQRHIRRIPHPTRGLGSNRARRTNMHFSSTSGGTSSVSPSGTRDNIDPIAELLSQLSGVRRVTTGNASAQLQQLQIQLQLERQQVRAARQQLERLPRRQPPSSSGTTASGRVDTRGATLTAIAASGLPSTIGNASCIINYNNNNSGSGASGGVSGAGSAGRVQSLQAITTESALSYLRPSSSNQQNCNIQLLMNKLTDTTISENELQTADVERADRAMYMREIFLTNLAEKKEEDTRAHKKRLTAKQTQPESGGAVSTNKQQCDQTAVKRCAQSKTASQIQRASQPQQQPPQVQATAAPQVRTASTPRTTVMHSSNILLVGNSYNADTSRRKPLCSLDATVNKTSSEPPTSH